MARNTDSKNDNNTNSEQVSSDPTSVAINNLRIRRAKNEKKKGRQRVIFIFIILLIIIALTMSVINLIFRNSTPEPQLYIVTEDNLEQDLRTTALILRDETIVDANASGILMPYKSSGEKVAQGDLIAKTFSDAAIPILEQIDILDQEISERQLELIASGNVSENTDIDQIYNSYDRDLKVYVSRLRSISNEEIDISAMANIDEEIDLKLRERSSALTAIDFYDEELSELIGQRESLQTQLANYESNIYATSSGNVSYVVDRYSRPFNQDQIGRLTVRDFEGYDASSSKIGARINSGESALSISSSFEQHYVIIVSEEEAEDFVLNSYYDLNFPRQIVEIENAQLRYMEEMGSGNVKLSFASSDHIHDLADSRQIEISVRLFSPQGFKVPNNAVQEDDGQAFVMVLRSGYTYRQDVNVIARDQNYTIIENIEEPEHVLADGSIVIQNPEVVEDGDQITN